MDPITKNERRDAIDRAAAQSIFRRRLQIDQLLADRRLKRENREVWDEHPLRNT